MRGAWEVGFFYTPTRHIAAVNIEPLKLAFFSDNGAGLSALSQQFKAVAGGLSWILNSVAPYADSLDDSTVSWSGDVRDMPRGSRSTVRKLLAEEGAIVVWKQARDVNWVVEDYKELAVAASRGDVTNYQDWVGLYVCDNEKRKVSRESIRNKAR
jgi:hypothetical protein